MSKTAAYNANEVAAVYMSFDRRDLLSSDEGGTGNLSDASLRNGFYGLSDPLNLRGTLQRFECDFTRGSNTAHYRIRLINPTNELEKKLIEFFEEVFPAKQSTFTNYADAVDEDKSMNDPEGAPEVIGEGLGALPIIYLRFGYGTGEEQGLSRIHKTVLNDLKYIVQESADKVLELQLTDQFTYTSVNRSFNQRPFVEKVSVLDADNSLKKPSTILSEVLEGYTMAYPTCRPMIDLGSYAEPIDSLTFSLAAALAKEDKTSELITTTIVSEEGQYQLTDKERENIEDLLDRPITSELSVDRKAEGVITQSILYQAYKLMFEQIGMKWKAGDKEITPGIVLNTADNQLNDLMFAVEYPENQSAVDQIEDANVQSDEDLVIDIKEEYLDKNWLPQYATNSLRESRRDVFFGQNLSFYPKVLDFPKVEEEDIVEFKIADITKIYLSSVEFGFVRAIDGAVDNEFGTEPSLVPPLPDVIYDTDTKKEALVVEMNQNVIASTRPLTQYVQNDLDPERPSNDYPGRFVVPSYETFESGGGAFYTPKWYPYQEDSPTSQSFQLFSTNQPVRIRLENIEGMTELNGKNFYLFSFNGFGEKPEYKGKYFLVEEDWYAANEGSILDNVFPYAPSPNGVQFAGDEDDTTDYSLYAGNGIVIRADDAEEANLQGEKVLRFPTEEEKQTIPKLYLYPGVVNPNNYTPEAENPSKNKFSKSEIDGLIDADNIIRVVQDGSGTINPLQVNIPTINDFIYYKERNELHYSYIEDTPFKTQGISQGPFTTNRIVPNRTPATPNADAHQGPVFDKETSTFLAVSSNLWDSLPDPYREWYDYANYAWYNSSGFPTLRTTADFRPLSREEQEEQFPQLCRNMPLVELEPTRDTAQWLMFLDANANQVAQAEKIEEERREAENQQARQEVEDANDKVPTPPEPPKTKAAPLTNSFVYMGTTDKSPHITGALRTIINGINKLIIGKSSKMEVIPMEVSKLSPEDKQWLTNNSPEFKETNWEERWADKNFTLLKIAPTSTTSRITDGLIRPVLSFPQTNWPLSGGDFYAPNKRNDFNKVIKLDYGTPNSLVAKLDFQGDTRVLVNMANANYAVRQWNDMAEIFQDGGPSKQIVYKVLSAAISNKLQLMKKAAVSTGQSLSEVINSKPFQEWLEKKSRVTLDPDVEESEFVMDLDLVQLLPELLGYLPKDDVERLVGGEKDVEELKLLASVVQNDDFINLVYPDDDVEGTNNVRKVETVIVETTPDGTAVRKNIKNKIITPRKVDFAQIYNRIGDVQLLEKMSDFEFSYYNAMAQEFFEITLTTLGIPEIDDIATEFLSRLIVFEYKDVRLKNAQNHWLSGVYRINGFKHRIDPEIGFITELSLYKDIEYNITKITNG